MTNLLSQKKCKPCEGETKAFDRAAAEEYLKQTPGWQLTPDYKRICREYVTKNFMEAVRFINKTAEIAESENHHPDISLREYRRLKIELSTHAISGLSENDFIVAAKLNELPVEVKK